MANVPPFAPNVLPFLAATPRCSSWNAPLILQGSEHMASVLDCFLNRPTVRHQCNHISFANQRFGLHHGLYGKQGLGFHKSGIFDPHLRSSSPGQRPPWMMTMMMMLMMHDRMTCPVAGVIAVSFVVNPTCCHNLRSSMLDDNFDPTKKRGTL